MIAKPIRVIPLENFKIELYFDDGISGQIDLSELKSKGVFSLWDNYENFKKVYIDNETTAIAWSPEVEIDVNNLYLKLTGKSFSEWQKENLIHASGK